jgi:hypothetical protein
MEPKGSLPGSQQPANEPHKSNAHLTPVFFETHFNIVLPYTPKFPTWPLAFRLLWEANVMQKRESSYLLNNGRLFQQLQLWPLSVQSRSCPDTHPGYLTSSSIVGTQNSSMSLPSMKQCMHVVWMSCCLRFCIPHRGCWYSFVAQINLLLNTRWMTQIQSRLVKAMESHNTPWRRLGGKKI